MVEFTTLSISGYGNKAVPNTFVRQSGETKWLAVIYPGLSYNVSMPVLYYSGRVLATLGADVLLVDTTYDRKAEYAAMSEAGREEWLKADALAAFEAAYGQRSYERVSLVGKSIGTLAMGHVIEGHRELTNLECAWLTPLLNNGRLREQMGMAQHRALFVIGTADPYFNEQRLHEAQRTTSGEAMVIEGANHSLEAAGEVGKSVEVMKEVVEKLEKFFRELK